MTTTTAVKKAPPGRQKGRAPGAATPGSGGQGTAQPARSDGKGVPQAASSRRRGYTPLTPMRQETAKRIRKLAGQVQQSHPDMSVHDHLRDAARVLESGNEEGAQRHLRAAMFALSPQSLMKNGLHTDDAHQAARSHVHGVHRHLLLVKDIVDAGAQNQRLITRDSYGDDSTAPARPDPNAGYGSGALAQKPTARQPPGNQAMNAPGRSSSGGSDPNAADPDGPQPRGSKQFAYGWDDLSRVIELVGPHGYIHGWIFVGVPAAGAEVYHPGHGRGTVTEASGSHVKVAFESGHSAAFPVRHSQGPGHFEQMSDDELESEVGRSLEKSGSGSSRFQAAAAELDRRDARAKAARVSALYAEKPKTEADRSRVYQGLVNEGEDPEEAWAHAHGTNPEAMQKQAAIQQLRAQGYKGGGLDALSRAAYKDEIRRRVVSAEGATNGYMLNPAGKKAGIDPWSLFTGPESRARKYASPELKEWWDQNGRPTAADFQAQLIGQKAGMRPADFYASVTWDELSRVIELVGPHGYIHGWIFVGIPGAGQKVTLGSGKHRTGTAEGADATHLHVRMADGSLVHVAHNGGSGKGVLAKVPSAVPRYSSTQAGRERLSKALVAAIGAGAHWAGSPEGRQAQTGKLSRAVAEHSRLASDEVLNEHVAGMRASLGADDGPSFSAHRDAVEARLRQHGMMPARDPGAAPEGKRSAGNPKQLSLLGERMNGPDRTSGLMKAGDMQEGYQAIGQAPTGIIGGTSDPWWMAGPGGTFALSVRGASGNRQLIPWSSEKQEENVARALKATRQRGNYVSGGSNYQQALAKTAVARAAHEAASVKPASVKRGSLPEAMAARQVADGIRSERGLTRGQREEGEQRLLKAAQHLDAGNHEEAAAELDAAMHATSLRGGGVIKGSTAAKARALRDTVRAGQPAAPALTADRLNMAGASGGKRAQRAALKQAPLADLRAVDAENARRAVLLGKPGQVSATHQLVKDEIATRQAGGKKTVNAAYSWGELAAAIELSAQTAALERTPAPIGKPGGPGLYHVKGLGHSDYFQQVRNGLMKRGVPEGKAHAMTWGILRRWAAGGGHVHPEVQAAAAKALAGEAAAAAKAHAHAVTWDDIGAVIELGTRGSDGASWDDIARAVELAAPPFNAALHPRAPAGAANGGQFAAGGAGTGTAQGQQGQGKQPAQPKPTAHQLHVLHVAHVNKVSTQKAELQVAAQDDRQKAAALIKQRDALVAALASAGGKVSKGQAGAKTASTAKTKSSAPAKSTTGAAPAKTSSTAPAKSAKAPAKASSAKGATATAGAPKAGSAAAAKAQIAALNIQISALLAQAAQAEAQAAKMT